MAAVVVASGTLNAVTTVQVGSQISGQIKDIYADFNTPVKKGQVIAHRRGDFRAARQPDPRRPGRRRKRGGGGALRALAQHAEFGRVKIAPRRRRARPRTQEDAGRQEIHLAGGARQGERGAGQHTPAIESGAGADRGERSAGAKRARRREAARLAAQAGPGGPRAHHHPRAGGRHGDPAQRRRRADGHDEHCRRQCCSRSRRTCATCRSRPRSTRPTSNACAWGSGRPSRSTPSPGAPSTARSSRSASHRRTCRTS